MTRPRRVVLDTNVVLSALVFANGRLAPLRRAWNDGRIVCLASTDTVGELVRALAYPKFRLDADERSDLLADYLLGCETVRVPDRVARVPECRDPADAPFLKLALAGRADAIVTGDGDLTSIAATCPVEIVSPAAMIEQLAAAPPRRR